VFPESKSLTSVGKPKISQRPKGEGECFAPFKLILSQTQD